MVYTWTRERMTHDKLLCRFVSVLTRSEGDLVTVNSQLSSHSSDFIFEL